MAATTMTLPMIQPTQRVDDQVSAAAKSVVKTINDAGLLKVLIFHLRIEGRPDCTAALLNLRSAEGQEKLDWVIGVIVSTRHLIPVNSDEFAKALVKELRWRHEVPTALR